jgi:hypothetical protein
MPLALSFEMSEAPMPEIVSYDEVDKMLRWRTVSLDLIDIDDTTLCRVSFAIGKDGKLLVAPLTSSMSSPLYTDPPPMTAVLSWDTKAFRDLEGVSMIS